jgi:hypothetical protein
MAAYFIQWYYFDLFFRFGLIQFSFVSTKIRFDDVILMDVDVARETCAGSSAWHSSPVHACTRENQ